MYGNILYSTFRSQFLHFAPPTCPVPEFIDPVLAKLAQNASFQSLKMSVLGLFSRKLGL